ncbi:MAG: ROK family protein [Propionibacteriales bacterium]|nr:ROK family protein [Propionibacteriales bacterium]
MRLPPLPTGARALAVDVGGSTIKAEVVAGLGEVLASVVEPTPSGDAALESVCRLGQHLIDEVEAGSGGRVSRAGLALPGTVDRDCGLGVYSANVGWRHLSFGPPLEAAWGMPVLVDHDVTVAGWAEWQVGAARGCDDVFFVALGTGVAAAIVAGGRLLRGGLSQGGEFGHVVVRPDGPICGCGGRGCVEAVSSATSIARRYAALSGRHVEGAADVLDAMADDPVAVAVWDEALAALADGLINVVNILSPTRIVVGGGLAEAGDAVVKPLAGALGDRATIVPAPDIVAAEFGARAALVGAALLAQRGGTADG